MADTKKLAREYRDIERDFTFDPSVMNDEDERVRLVKKIINEKLSRVDKIMILLYIDCHSYRKLGQRLNLSHMTVRREVVRIKQQILEEYESMR